MSSNFNGQSTNTVNDNSNYINSERSETSPLYSSSKETGNLNFIITFFSVFSVAVAAALAIQIKYGNHQITPHGSIASDSKECSMIGISILQKGGNAIDAGIATTMCIGVIRPHLTGVGGGGLMLIYDHREGKVLDLIDFRPTRSTDIGIGVPGFLAGLALAHQLHGSLPWETLLAPSIQIARNGFKVTSSLIKAREEHHLQNSTHNLVLDAWLKDKTEGKIVKMPKLAMLLEKVAKSGAAGTFIQLSTGCGLSLCYCPPFILQSDTANRYRLS
ncbi:unnamed protein product [Bemisia tabaci]|uniref:Uncharacterized protein n=1 Tax=Bemisia tabaci TaxID=7038 RepID=A0A9P0AMH6_BEMTA|nr:unnamed protein product [Bemisia tabaci]